jgi:hypothetical protein
VTQARQLPVRHTGLVPCRSWQTPDRRLDLTFFPPQVMVRTSDGLMDAVDWRPEPSARRLLQSVRQDLDDFRKAHSEYLDAIDPDDLAASLERVTPASDWRFSTGPADRRHLQTWYQVATSDELRRLATRGNQLYEAMFRAGTPLRKWIDDLQPGDRLDVTWFGQDEQLISHVPWALMYRPPAPKPGSIVDPAGFLGLRLRIAYKPHRMRAYTRALGELRETTRAHILYWGGTANDETAAEAMRHKQELAGWGPLVLPSGQDYRKREVSRFLATPKPSPVSVLYLYCRCNRGARDPVLQFGSTNGPEDLIDLIDIGGDQLDDQPLAFLNGCDTAYAQPFFSNELEDLFLDRGCRAFIGTEAKVPIGLAARFAATFFTLLYRDHGCPVSAGEAFAQARKFLWDEYRNLGGLLYSYVNDYDLFAASDERVAALRQAS